MQISAGTRLGPYEIISRIGAGGMGEVWRARDTRLDRIVAIKVLPEELEASPERKRRFQREARLISQLNHPNICTLHDIGEGYLVMELLEGQTLAERIARGPLPMTEVFAYGMQIAEGLDRAHRAGIVHRDLKPGNIMLTKSGAKLLDFGLAKSGADTDSECETDALTQEGTLLGTVQYMAPEQVEGREADARSDMFAFGAILYEMVTGKRAFQAESRASLIAAILTSEPALLAESRTGSKSGSASSRNLARIEHVVRPCLEKDPDRRWQNALDVANELRWIAERDVEAEPGSQRHVTRPWMISMLLLSLIAIIATGTAIWFGRRNVSQVTATVAPVSRLIRLTWGGESLQPSISPDGGSFAYVSQPPGLRDFSQSDILVRRIEGENPINLTKDHKGGDWGPAFSPDGQSIAFRSNRDGGGIFIMGASGESVRRLTDFGYNPAWSPDGKTIAFSSERDSIFGQSVSSLWLVNVATEEKRKIFEGDAVCPSWSPSGTRLVFHGRLQSISPVSLFTIAISGGVPTQVVSSTSFQGFACWTPGWIWYGSGDRGPVSPWRVRVDDATGKTIGSPEPVIRSPIEASFPSVSPASSRVLFVTTSREVSLLRWEFDADRGRVSTDPRPIMAVGRAVHNFTQPSPDGEWIAAALFHEKQRDILLVRAATGETRRLTNDSLQEASSWAWAPDSSKLYFCVAPDGKSELWSIRPDGSGRQHECGSAEIGEIVRVIASPDGRALYVEAGKTFQPGLVDVTIPTALRKPIPLPRMPDERIFNGRYWSPDGRWIVGYPRKEDGTVADGLHLFDLEKRTYQKIGDVKGDDECWWLTDSRRILLWSKSGELTILDRESGLTRAVGSVGPGVFNLELSHDGRWLVGNTQHLQSDIWMLDSGTKQ